MTKAMDSLRNSLKCDTPDSINLFGRDSHGSCTFLKRFHHIKKQVFRIPVLLIILLLFMSGIAFGEKNYRFEIIARTGMTIGDAGEIIDLGYGPSINDYGRVAFVARTENEYGEQSHVIISDWGKMARIATAAPTERIGTDVQINNSDSVVWWYTIEAPGSARDGDTEIIRFDLPVDEEDPVIGRGSNYFTTEFQHVLPWASLNNNGGVVFSGDLKSGGTVLAYEDDQFGPGPDTMSSKISNFPIYFPMIADNNRIVFRSGNNVNSPLIVFLDETFNEPAALWIATSNYFNLIGKKPGISDDGRIVAFMGDSKTEGPGIYIAVINDSGNSAELSRIVDIPDPNPLDQMRLGVNKSGSKPDNYTVVFLANGPTGQISLYSALVDISNPSIPPELVNLIAIGSTIEGLEELGSIENIGLYDAISNSGQIVFWVDAENGKAIVRARPAIKIECFDANPEYAGPGIVDIVSRFDLPPDFDALAKFEPIGLEDESHRQVKTVAADGVTLLFLRFTIESDTNGEVTFALQSESDAPMGSLWPVGSGPKSSLISESNSSGDWDDEAQPGQNMLTIPTHSYNGKTYAFVLYRAPRNFDRNEPDDLGASWWERIRHVQVKASFSPSDGNQNLEGEAIVQISIVRPPVLLIHGTFSSPETWDDFPIWIDGASSNNGYTFSDDFTPFVVYRLSWAKNNSGRLETNAKIVLREISYAIDQFRTTPAFIDAGINRIAVSQADIVTHSFGGPVTRKASQLQLFEDPLTFLKEGNFRALYNWGYGYIHKFISIAGTHKGSQIPPHTAQVNAESGGIFSKIAKRVGLRIECGATADQNVVSDALRSLTETKFPSHAIAGSGLIEQSVLAEKVPFFVYSFLSCNSLSPLVRNGPYCVEQNGSRRRVTLRQLVNYVFNLDHEKGAQQNISNTLPWPSGDAPNYDLTIRLPSMFGFITDELYSIGISQNGPFTDVYNLDPFSPPSDSLVGQLSHLTEPSSFDVSLKVNFLLHQPTKSSYFARFPAVAPQILDELDKQMMTQFPQNQVEAWLLEGGSEDTCPEKIFQE